MIETQITDGRGRANIADVHKDNGDMGLVVFTEPLRDYVQKSAFALNSTYGFEMAQDGAFGGTPDIVHVGVSDGVNWTGSNIVGGKGDFNSGDRANSGTVSVKWDNMALNDIIEFDKGSDIAVSDHVAISMFVNIDKDWSAGDSISLYAYDTGTSLTVGNEVLLENYVNEFDFDVWQNAVIPFNDLGLSVVDFDAIRLAHTGKGGGKSPKFYIDDFRVESIGTPLSFSITPEVGEIFTVSSVTLTFIDDVSNTLTNASTQNISYDKFLGLDKLPNGLLLVRIQNGVVKSSSIATCAGDFTTIVGAKIGDNYGDGTNTVLSFDIKFTVPVPLDPRTDDALVFTVRDDLTDLISLTALATGSVRNYNT